VTTIYVCGPMSGYPNHNEERFRFVAQQLERQDFVPVVPHDVKPIEHEGPCPASHVAETTGKHDVACFLRADVIAMLERCDGIYVLRGWETSVGARLEVSVAAHCGLSIEFELYDQRT
jgi:Domain of unknown function (DUF4406)